LNTEYRPQAGGALAGANRVSGKLPRAILVPLLVLAGSLLLAPGARAQEATFPLLFTEELIDMLATDNQGERTKEIADRIIGLSPSVRSVRLQRAGGRIGLFIAASGADGIPVSFQFTVDKMIYYRMRTARADVAGMAGALQEAKAAEPLIRAVGYRFEGRYSIIEVTLDMRPAIEEARELQARREVEARAAAEAKAAAEAQAAAEEKAAAEAAKAAKAAKAAAKATAEARAATEAVRAGTDVKSGGPTAPPAPVPEGKQLPVATGAATPPPREAAYLSAKFLGLETAPIVDGQPSEAAWQAAPRLALELWGASGRFPVTVAALWSLERIWILVRWPDRSKDNAHHPWVWSKEEGVYLVGSAVEDALSLSFSREGRMGECMLAGAEAATDLWTWRAGRTDPSGYAEDATMRLSLQRLPRANSYQARNGRTIWVREEPDAGSPAYEAQIAGDYAGDRVPRYAARTPSGSMADVTAKGSWSEGFWTVELSRRLSTGDPVDVVFGRGRETFFSIAVFDAREGIEHSTSNELVLKFE
jgi:hypothetical protein